MSMLELFDPFARQMVKNAIAWARANRKVRNNPVHGAEEFRVATFEGFNHKERDRTTTTASVEADLEDSHLLAISYAVLTENNIRFKHLNAIKSYDIVYPVSPWLAFAFGRMLRVSLTTLSLPKVLWRPLVSST